MKELQFEENKRAIDIMRIPYVKPKEQIKIIAQLILKPDKDNQTYTDISTQYPDISMLAVRSGQHIRKIGQEWPGSREK